MTNITGYNHYGYNDYYKKYSNSPSEASGASVISGASGTSGACISNNTNNASGNSSAIGSYKANGLLSKNLNTKVNEQQQLNQYKQIDVKDKILEIEKKDDSNKLKKFLDTWESVNDLNVHDRNLDDLMENQSNEQVNISKIFNGETGMGAFTLYGNLESMLSNSDASVRRFANMILETFNKYGVNDREDLKIYLLQQIISQINKTTGRTDGGIGLYNIRPEELQSLSNDGKFFTNLKNILESTELQETFNGAFDSSLGEFMQSSSGPCWMIAGLKALNATVTGKELIKNCISWAPDHSSVTIKFQGVNKSYSINLIDLIDYRDLYAYGDLEAVAFAKATEMLRRDIQSGAVQVSSYRDFNHYNEDDNGNPGEGIYGGNTDQFFYFLTGKTDGSDGSPFGNEKIDPKVYGYEFLQHVLEDGFNNYSSIFTLNNENLYNFYKNHNVNNLSEEDLSALKNGGHSFAITGITNGTVTISDPATTVDITISWTEFCNMGIDYISELYIGSMSTDPYVR